MPQVGASDLQCSCPETRSDSTVCTAVTALTDALLTTLEERVVERPAVFGPPVLAPIIDKTDVANEFFELAVAINGIQEGDQSVNTPTVVFASKVLRSADTASFESPK
jgi:hypothetical protein